MTPVQENMLNKVREEIQVMRNQLDWVMYRSEPLSNKEFNKIREAYDLVCKATIDTTNIGDKLFDAVSNGKISTSEYKTAVAGWKIIKKVL
jgi:hypothetical protein